MIKQTFLLLILFLAINIHSSKSTYIYENVSYLPCPRPIYPSGGEIPFLPRIDWTDVSGAITYELQLSINSSFTIIILSIEVSKSHYQLLIPLLPFTTYFWRVRATDDSAYGDFCWSISFNTGGGNFK